MSGAPPDPSPILEAAARRLADDPCGAERLALKVLETAPRDVRARLVLGAARRRLGDLEGARAILEPLALAQPQAAFARSEAVACLHAMARLAAEEGRYDRVEDLAGRCLVLEPNDTSALALIAGCRLLLGDAAGAVTLYERLVAVAADRPEPWLGLGHALKTLGRVAAAARAYEHCLSFAPGHGEAWWSLANLKTVPLTLAQSAAIDAALAAPALPARERTWLLYARGKALEDRGAWDAAFAAYAEGARRRREEGGYDPQAAHDLGVRTRDALTSDFFRARGEGGADSDAPIFIVGLPRSGSTLIEQILASHPRVEGTGELPYLVDLARGLAAEGGYLEALAALTPEQRSEMGESYLARAGAHRRTSAPRFVDKAPNNFHHIGLIRLILPKATIIDARRHPMACGVSAFKQLFAGGHDWSYDLAEIGGHIRDYLTLMDHFDAVLPGHVRRVIHEDLVADFEPQVRRLLAACSLDFHPAALRFWETDRPVASASAAQVRRPLDRAGLEHWRVFEAHLAPLALALGEAMGGWRGHPGHGGAIQAPGAFEPGGALG